MKKKLLLLVLTAALVAVTAAPTFIASHEDRKATPAESITEAELHDHMFYLASEELRGRETGTPDYALAADYCAAQFREAGLIPAVKDRQGNGTFLQQVPMAEVAFGEGNRLVFMSGSKSTDLSFGDDFLLLLSPQAESGSVETGLLFLGHGISEPDHGWDDYQGIDVRGKAVAFTLGAPLKDGKPVLPEEQNRLYANPFRSISSKIRTAEKQGASLAVIIPDEQLAGNWDRFRRFMTRSRVVTTSAEEQEDGRIPAILVSADALKTAFGEGTFEPSHRSATGRIQAGWAVRIDTDIRRTDFNSVNVVAMIPGSDPELKEEVVTIGAHLDHEGMREGVVYPGADDNASGVVSSLEVAEALALSPGRRTVMIILYTGEEKGLLGSGYFVEHSPVPLDKIVANINLDMVGRYDVESQDANILYAVGSDMICKDFKAVIEQVNGNTLDLPLEYKDPHNYFPRSDQVHFHRAGIPAVFFTIDDHVDYHKPTDTAEKIHYGNMEKISRLVYHLALELANREERICADKN